MTFPTAAVVTTNMDAGTDSPASARSDLADLAQKFNQLTAHVNALNQGLLANAGVLRNYIAGCIMSTAGSSGTFAVAAGVAMDSTNAWLINVAAISKTDAAWAVGSGNGGLDTGSITGSIAWYHVYAIRRPDTGVVDVIFSLNASAPALPANYTQYRRIGSLLYQTGSKWERFIQIGDEFLWYDIGSLQGYRYGPSLGTAPVLRIVASPDGIQTRVRLMVGLEMSSASGGVSGCGVLISSPSVGATNVPTQSVTPGRFVGQLNPALSTVSGGNSVQQQSAEVEVWTNTTSQVRTELSDSSAGTYLFLTTLGWMDPRGKDL